MASIASIANIANSIQQSLVAAQRVHEVLTAPLEIQNRPNAQRLPQPRGAVAFAGVAFGYQPAEPVLRDITLDVQPGQLVGLTGDLNGPRADKEWAQVPPLKPMQAKAK